MPDNAPVSMEQAQETPITQAPALDAQQQEAAKDFAPEPWQNALPESWRGEVEGLGSMEDALAAMKRGMSYHPAQSIDDLVTNAPEGVELDEGLNRSFRELGVKIGLTREQAQALVNFEVQQFAAMERQAAEAAEAELRGRFGLSYDGMLSKAGETMMKVDAKMGNRLSAALGEGGLKNSPALMEAFSIIGSMLSEDSLAGSTMGGSGAEKPEQAEAMFASMFPGAR